jgi:thiol-disulfide isomerase/thioredoxin
VLNLIESILQGEFMRKAFRFLLFTSLLLLFSTVSLAASIVRDINFSDYKGKWVVINYWATWCGYCLEEIPELNAFYRAHHNQVAMFGVNYDDPGNLPRHIQQSGVIFPTLAVDPKRQLGLSRVSGLPTTLLIAPNGRLHVLTGPQTKSDLEEATGL